MSKSSAPARVIIKPLIAMIIALLAVLGSTQTAQAAPMVHTGFTVRATMTVQAGAAARYDAGIYDNLVGWVSSDGWRNPNGQKSYVSCYTDGGWATGNYSSNRWFLVYVNVGGYRNPVWAYVHSSYVTNQSAVPSC